MRVKIEATNIRWFDYDSEMDAHYQRVEDNDTMHHWITDTEDLAALIRELEELTSESEFVVSPLADGGFNIEIYNDYRE